jgi:hypothetical protein
MMQWFGSQIQNQIEQLYSFEYNIALDYKVTLECVWYCDSGYFLNSFSCWNTCQWFFLFFKNYFWHQHIKTIQKVQTALNFNKKKLKFDQTQVQPQSQTS